MTFWIGTSGWQYRDWRGAFYPQPLAQKGWLAHYAARFQTVELNNSFYRLPSRAAFESWAAGTPDDFIVTVKASRYLTHMTKMKEPEGPVELLMERARGLGSKLGPVLVQLPPQLPRADERLRRCLAAFPDDVRVAVEFRHDSWYVPEVRALLETHGAALVWADRLSKPMGPLWRTTDWTFVRFHEGTGTPRPCYGRTAIAARLEALAERWTVDEDVWVYFNNDPRGCAVRDARRFAAACDRLGLPRTRVPGPREIAVVGLRDG